jgi:hypothetical protein
VSILDLGPSSHGRKSVWRDNGGSPTVVGVEELCVCGSGRLFRCCHGVGGRERRQRGSELRALAELHDLALLFPCVRPRGVAIEAFADRVAAGIDKPRDSTPAEVAEGVALISVAERMRLVGCWRDRYPERWAKICASIGDTVLAEQGLLASTVRAAIADRVVCPPEVVADLEDGRLERSPGAALALALLPPAVWSYEEVFAPNELAVTEVHVRRVRLQAARLRRRLPFQGLPRASATLIRGCELVDTNDDLAAGVAELLVDSYIVMFQARTARIGRRN